MEAIHLLRQKKNQQYRTSKLRLHLIFFLPFISSAAFAGIYESVKNIDGVEVDWGATVSYGASWRLEEPNPRFEARGNYADLALKTQINKNDGDNNFDTGLVSSVAKFTSELQIKYHNYGSFLRATGFYDNQIMHGHHQGGQIDQFENNGYGDDFGAEVKDVAGSRVRFLDAYVWSDYTIAERAVSVRAGQQVLNWGEALFFQDGINSANSVSLTQLRLPGSEVKEVLLPLPMLFAQMNLTQNLNVEAFYEFAWEPSEADPAGTFLSTHDAFIGPGSQSVLVDFKGSSAEQIVTAYNQVSRGVSATDPRSTRIFVDRRADVNPSDSGQFGLAFRYFAQALNDTEFGLYFLNYHAHKQVAGAVTGQPFGSGIEGTSACQATKLMLAQAGIGGQACADHTKILAGLPINATGITNQTVQQALGDSVNNAAKQLIGGANAIHFVDTSEYLFYYPEDIKLYGVSFNTHLGETAIAGEIAYRPDGVFLPETGDNLIAYNALAASTLGNSTTASVNYGPHISGVTANETIIVMDEKDMVNLSLSATHSFGPVMKIDNLFTVVELGLAHVAGLDEDKLYAAEQALLYLVDASGNPVRTEGTPEQYLTKNSWGYRWVVGADFNNAFNGVKLTPMLRFAHDVNGNSVFGGNFVEDRKSATLSLEATYLVNFQAGLNYTTFWNASDRNQLIDRDFASFNVKYSF